MNRRFNVSPVASAAKQFQGSKKKARTKAFLEWKAQKDSDRKNRERLHAPDCGIEEMAAIMGIKLR